MKWKVFAVLMAVAVAGVSAGLIAFNVQHNDTIEVEAELTYDNQPAEDLTLFGDATISVGDTHTTSHWLNFSGDGTAIVTFEPRHSNTSTDYEGLNYTIEYYNGSDWCMLAWVNGTGSWKDGSLTLNTGDAIELRRSFIAHPLLKSDTYEYTTNIFRVD